MMQSLRLILKGFAVHLWDKIITRKPISILMYHSIGYNKEFFNVTPEDFAWQMQYLHKNKYNVISLGQLVESMRTKQKLPQKSIIITFDDGYEDNYVKAFPILKKHNFPATIFSTVGRLGSDNYVNWDEIREMHNSGLIDFEPHTMNHPKLSQISTEVVEREMKESKLEIESKLSKKCEFFAYPYGNYDEKSLKISQNLFKATLSVKGGFIGHLDSVYELKRNSIDSLTTPLLFRLKI
jgi:peptidoglycan/xylan/chitin deacetylase (PgdA/CDA1 family)